MYTTAMWFIFALVSGAFYTISGLMTRHILKGNRDAWAFSFFFSAIGAVISVPFILRSPQFPVSVLPWIIMFVVGLLIVLQNYFNFKSSNYIEASITGTVSKFRLVWVFILGILILHESFTWQKLIGTGLTIFAGILLISQKNISVRLKGVLFAFIATFFYATVILLYKILFSSFNSQTLTFFIFLIPAVINVFIMPHAIRRMKDMMKHHGYTTIIACAAGGFANLAMNHALSIGEVTKTLVIIEAFLLITLIGETLILKERNNLLRKTIVTILAILGAILIRV